MNREKMLQIISDGRKEQIRSILKNIDCTVEDAENLVVDRIGKLNRSDEIFIEKLITERKFKIREAISRTEKSLDVVYVGKQLTMSLAILYLFNLRNTKHTISATGNDLLDGSVKLIILKKRKEM